MNINLRGSSLIYFFWFIERSETIRMTITNIFAFITSKLVSRVLWWLFVPWKLGCQAEILDIFLTFSLFSEQILTFSVFDILENKQHFQLTSYIRVNTFAIFLSFQRFLIDISTIFSILHFHLKGKDAELYITAETFRTLKYKKLMLRFWIRISAYHPNLPIPPKTIIILCCLSADTECSLAARLTSNIVKDEVIELRWEVR